VGNAARCEHQTKCRLVGADPRLYRCIGSLATLSPNDTGCNELFVQGRTWRGEQRWIPVGTKNMTDIDCTWCLDGLDTPLRGGPCPNCARTFNTPDHRPGI
jgi:hypothetical protein